MLPTHFEAWSISFFATGILRYCMNVLFHIGWSHGYPALKFVLYLLLGMVYRPSLLIPIPSFIPRGVGYPISFNH